MASSATPRAPEDAAAGRPSPAVQLRGVSKRFPGVVANDRVDFSADAGEVHALLGENGAGKTTLCNILTGLYRPDEGELAVHNQRVDFHAPRDALAAGICMVHQHFRLVATFTVAENLALGRSHRGGRRALEARVRELGERYRLPVDPRAHIWQLSVGEQQRVELLKALHQDARILILDEPTAVLTPQETAVLFATLRQMAAEGRTVVLVSHKLEEVVRVADRITVLRDGAVVGTVAAAATDARQLAYMMVGRDVVLERRQRRSGTAADAASASVILAVRSLTAMGDRGGLALRRIDLTLRAGEILGVAGVAGNGQRELAEALTGLRPPASGEVLVGGQPLRSQPRAAIRAGVAYIPEDRLGTGLAPGLSIADNLALKSYRRPPASTGPLLRRRRMYAHAAELMRRFEVRAPSPRVSTRLLSGGNVQRVLLAREFDAAPRVLVAASPTRGLDVGATQVVREHLLAVARAGVGVLLISEDLDELLALADRIVVLYEGRIAGEVDAAGADLTELGLLMAGAGGAGAGQEAAADGPGAGETP
jgi:general nucleoside transport system ATP-binding protein